MQKSLAHLALLLTACASTPRSEGLHEARFEGHAVQSVREAARVVVAEFAHPVSEVRIKDDGSVLTEGWAGACGTEVACTTRVGYPGSAPTPWTTIAVRFHDLGTATAAEVVIAFEDCDPDVDCEPQLLGSTGKLERRILDGIRARLESPEENPLAEL